VKPVSARREMGIVLLLAVLGLALVTTIAFAPWYTPSEQRGSAAVVETVPPAAAHPVTR
jgi:hypothetical protein